MKWIAKVKDGKLDMYNKEKFVEWFKTLEGKEVEVTVEKKKKTRTIQENRYYWGIMLDILSSHTGYETDEMNEIIKYKFLQVDDGKNTYCRSTKNLSTVEFEELMSRIRRWASSELSLWVPAPNEKW